MDKDEPPSSNGSKCSLFLVGKDSHGNWVAQDQDGLCGGLFLDRAEALKFAMFENGNHPLAIMMVPGLLELNMSAKSRIAQPPEANSQAPSQRVA